MTVLVFGKTGQVATELRRLGDVVALGRDEADLAHPEACAAVIRRIKPSAVINAAAYTGVDKAEVEEGLATTINGAAPGAMAAAAADLGVPFLHISTDYVFNGTGDRPWLPEDVPGPLGCLWPFETGRRDRYPRGGRAMGGVAHILGVFGAWREFRQDNAAAGRGTRQPARGVRSGRRADGSGGYCGGAIGDDGADARRPVKGRHLSF